MTSTAIIVAGGKSRRFGSNKALHEIAGHSMIRLVASALGPIFEEIIVAGGDKEQIESLGLRCIPDAFPGRGVLGGLHTGLTHASAPEVFLCGCDMPLLQPAAIKVVLDHAGDALITLPVIAGKRQPLHAVYHKSILPVVERLLAEPDIFLPDLFDEVACCVVEESAFAPIADYRQSFININDLEALRLCEAVIRRRILSSQ